jgi:hypothetical protein
MRAFRSVNDIAKYSELSHLDIPPYIIAKIAESPATLANLDGQIRKISERRLREGWTIAKVAALPTEAIEDRLRKLGIDHSRASFLARTTATLSAWSISVAWLGERRTGSTDVDDNFLGFAACELWKRLSPGRPSIEMLDDWMQDGYNAVIAGSEREACAIWWKTWQVLHERFSPTMRRMADTTSVFSGMQSLFNWVQDFVMHLEDLALQDLEYASIGKHYCEQWAAQFPDEDAGMRARFLGCLADFSTQLDEANAEGKPT